MKQEPAISRDLEYQALRKFIRLIEASESGSLAESMAVALEEELTPRQRQVVHMYYIDQMLMRDIAETLGVNLTGSSIRLALGTTVPSVAQYASRVYVTTEKANDVMTVTEAMREVLPDASTQIVFVTTSHDTRFDAAGVIRPLLGGE